MRTCASWSWRSRFKPMSAAVWRGLSPSCRKPSAIGSVWKWRRRCAYRAAQNKRAGRRTHAGDSAAGYVHVLNPEATQMLFHDPTGVKLTKAAAVLEVLAFLTISRMVRVDY